MRLVSGLLESINQHVGDITSKIFMKVCQACFKIVRRMA